MQKKEYTGGNQWIGDQKVFGLSIIRTNPNGTIDVEIRGKSRDESGTTMRGRRTETFPNMEALEQFASRHGLR